MTNIPKSVPVTTVVLVIFTLLCGFQGMLHIALFLFGVLNIMVVWMVYSVLTYHYVSPYTFQERFYRDMNIKNNEPNENDSYIED